MHSPNVPSAGPLPLPEAVAKAGAERLTLPPGPGLNTAVRGAVGNAVAETGALAGGVLGAAFGLAPVAGVCLLSYMGMRMILGQEVWPFNQRSNSGAHA